MPKGILPKDQEASVRARELRRQMTPSEATLWALLRDSRLRGLKFRRQFPIGPFVADFCCYGLRLIVELDGLIHEAPAQVAHDENRDIYLSSRGYGILRFPNHRLLEHPDEVIEEIVHAAWQRGWVPKSNLSRAGASPYRR